MANGIKKPIFILAILVGVSGTYTYIAGYEPQSDVVQHSQIDLDVQEIVNLLPVADSGRLGDCSECDWESNNTKRVAIMEAWEIWQQGKNSAKSNSSRSIALFSRGAENKTSGNNNATDVDYQDNSYISVMNEYWASKGLSKYTWGHDIINATFYGQMIGDIDMGTVGDDFRREVIQKGIVYLNIYPYIIWEMQDAINDCNTGDLQQNDNAVHAWDEAVAFYTGSLEGVSQGGNNGLDSCTDGNCELLFMLADKRCMNFGTCTADYDNDDFAGYSKVNKDIFSLFTDGRDQILGATHTAECPKTPNTMEQIAGIMLIPFIQGVHRYLYKTSLAPTPTAKEAGELFVFASAVLPFIWRADPDTAEMLYNRAWNLDYSTDNWMDIKHAIEDTYPLLGVGAGVGVVTCKQVGEFNDNGNVRGEACVDQINGDKTGTIVTTWVIALTVVLAVLLLFAILYLIFIRRKYNNLLPLLEKETAKDLETASLIKEQKLETDNLKK